MKDSCNEIGGIKFTNDAIKCLGIYIGHNKQECHHKNWTEKINKMEMLLSEWKHRKLTLFGKVLIVKILALAKLTYVFSILRVPDDVVKQIKKCVFYFIWNDRDRIKRDTVIGSIKEGGLNMVDIDCNISALKCA